MGDSYFVVASQRSGEYFAVLRRIVTGKAGQVGCREKPQINNRRHIHSLLQLQFIAVCGVT